MASVLGGVLHRTRPTLRREGALLGPLFRGMYSPACGLAFLVSDNVNRRTQIGWPIWWAAFYVEKGLSAIGTGIYWALYYAVRERKHLVPPWL